METSFESFDPSIVDRARNRIIDVVGCSIAGATASGCSALENLAKEWGDKKESTILVHGGKVPPYHAAMVNSVMAGSYDFEPVGPYVHGKDNTPGHISGTIVPAALAVAEQKTSGGKK